MSGRRVTAWLCLLTLASVAAMFVARRPAGAAKSQRAAGPAAAALEQRIGAPVPRELGFVDTRDAPVRLSEQFRGERPVLLVMGYAACPNLCNLVLHGLLEAVARFASLAPGRDFRVLYVSLDAREPRQLAERKRAAMVARLGSGADGVSYLRGTEAAVQRLADSVGFHYAWDERSAQYVHPALAVVLAADGRVAAYVHGVAPDARALEASLRGAARGARQADLVGEILRCFRFERAARQHDAAIRTYLRIGALLVFALLAALIGALLRAGGRTP